MQKERKLPLIRERRERSKRNVSVQPKENFHIEDLRKRQDVEVGVSSWGGKRSRSKGHKG